MAGHPGMAAGFAARQCRLSSLPTAPAPSVRRRATSNGAIPVVRLTANLRARSRLRPPPEGRRSLACRAEKTPQFSKIDVESSTGLGDTSQEPFGPCAILLVGFSQLEVSTFSGCMQDMGADMVKIVSCNSSMMGGTLMEALETSPSEYLPTPPEYQRTIFLSGLYSSEIPEVLEEYKRSGLPPAIFAPAVPNNADSILAELCQEVLDDHLAMLQNRGQE
mmetsp:Transcript_25320/g.65194  ORF Transcript_25320/g.65194 Transcript_25320/m.65194 type:complete len:220 (+) Transcript_25320:122-781(+)